MYLYPAIDLVQGKAVRLFKGDYAQMTVYSDDPVSVAKDFQAAGSGHIHLVDLEGAKSGIPENLETIKGILAETDLFVEVGGGIRNPETVKRCNMIPASTPDEALEIAYQMKGRDASVVVIPDGVSVLAVAPE